MENTEPKPRNIFELINMNVVDMSKDLVLLHEKIDKVECVMQAIYDALYPQELPNADGEVLEEDEVISDHDKSKHYDKQDSIGCDYSCTRSR